jgi:hypothetical protein
MTNQLKLIAREPTEEMLSAAYHNCNCVAHSGNFKAMFDAAPVIESEAEKKAREFHEYALRYHIAPPDRFRVEALKIIRQLLAERGIK